MKLFEFDTTISVVFEEGPEEIFDVVEHTVQTNLEVLKTNNSTKVLCKVFGQWFLYEEAKEPRKVKEVTKCVDQD